MATIPSHLPKGFWDCPVCMEPLSEDVYTINRCRHSFHKICIKEWVKQKRDCPVCRTDHIGKTSLIKNKQMCQEYQNWKANPSSYQLESMDHLRPESLRGTSKGNWHREISFEESCAYFKECQRKGYSQEEKESARAELSSNVAREAERRRKKAAFRASRMLVKSFTCFNIGSKKSPERREQEQHAEIRGQQDRIGRQLDRVEGQHTEIREQHAEIRGQQDRIEGQHTEIREQHAEIRGEQGRIGRQLDRVEEQQNRLRKKNNVSREEIRMMIDAINESWSSRIWRKALSISKSRLVCDSSKFVYNKSVLAITAVSIILMHKLLYLQRSKGAE